MGIDERLTAEIVQRILSVARPERIILFGSAVTGQMTADSDIDVLVLEESPPPTPAHRTRIRRTLRGLGFPFDVMVMSTTRFEETKELIGGIAYPAKKYGRVIYEAA